MSETPPQNNFEVYQEDGYHLDVNEVAELLGVTRTRVSQLTSNGILSFERKRVGVRNRLFYKRSEVLSYQSQYYGKQIPISTVYRERAHQLTAHTLQEPNERNSITEQRVGASSGIAPRTHSLVPEQLYLETARIISQENNNSLLLTRIQETLNQLLLKATRETKSQNTSALNVELSEKVLEQIATLNQLIMALNLKIERQNEKISDLFLEFTSVRKGIKQLENHQQKTRSTHSELKSRESVQTPSHIIDSSSTKSMSQRSTTSKRTHRKQTAVKKRIFQRC